MPGKSLNYLSSLREEIVAFRAVKCHMSHERIISVARSMLPVVDRLPESNYQRVGLCSPETRAQRLGCSHTMARIKLESAIDELETGAREKNGLESFLRSELNWLNNEIHLLDHRKGEAEKALGLLEAYRASDRAGQVERFNEAEAKVREMERLHDEYVDRMGMLRDRVVTEMDRLVARYRLARGTSPTVREGSGTEPGAVATGIMIQRCVRLIDPTSGKDLKRRSSRLSPYPARYRSRFCNEGVRTSRFALCPLHLAVIQGAPQATIPDRRQTPQFAVAI